MCFDIHETSNAIYSTLETHWILKPIVVMQKVKNEESSELVNPSSSYTSVAIYMDRVKYFCLCIASSHLSSTRWLPKDTTWTWNFITSYRQGNLAAHLLKDSNGPESRGPKQSGATTPGLRHQDIRAWGQWQNPLQQKQPRKSASLDRWQNYIIANSILYLTKTSGYAGTASVEETRHLSASDWWTVNSARLHSPPEMRVQTCSCASTSLIYSGRKKITVWHIVAANSHESIINQ